MYYIICGPATLGNFFASYGAELPADRWAVVRDAEYSNGGHGPCLVSDACHRTEAGAAKELQAAVSQ